MSNVKNMELSDISNCSKETIEWREGQLGSDYESWTIYDYETEEEWEVTKNQWEIFADDDLEFDDQPILFQVVDGKAVVKLKSVRVFVRDLDKQSF